MHISGALSKAKSKRFFEFTVEVYMLATAHFEFKALLLSSFKSTGHLQPHTPTHFANKNKIEKSFRLHNEWKIFRNMVDNLVQSVVFLYCPVQRMSSSEIFKNKCAYTISICPLN